MLAVLGRSGLSIPLLLAQVTVPGTLIHWALILVVLCGVVGVVIVIMRQTGVSIPPFIVTILWIVLACIVGILAIKLIAGML